MDILINVDLVALAVLLLYALLVGLMKSERKIQNRRKYREEQAAKKRKGE